MQHLDLETISSYIDDELSTEEVAQVEAHLASCQQCRQEQREFLAVSRMVRNVPVYQPRRSALVNERSATRHVREISRFVRPLAVAAILLLAAVTGLVVIGEIVSPEPGGTDDASSSSQSVADMPGAAESNANEPSTTSREDQDTPGSGQLAAPTLPGVESGDGDNSSIARQIRIPLYVAMGAAIIGAAVWFHVQRTRRE